MNDGHNIPDLRRLSKYDQALLASAMRNLFRAGPAYTGRTSSTRSRVFMARYAGVCVRCECPITVGQDIRYHRDHGGYAHQGCRAPKVTSRTAHAVVKPPRPPRARAKPQPPLCPECHTEHAGECF